MFDLAIIGGGPGGYVAAIRAAQLGGRVILVEKDRLGGTCLNRGCIPTKALLASVEALEAVRHSQRFGVHLPGSDGASLDFDAVNARKQAVVARLGQGIAALLRRNKVEVLAGQGRLVAGLKSATNSLSRVEVVASEGTRELIEAKNVLLATGSEPALVKALGYDGKNVLTSNEILELTALPESLLIIGGGVIGCEFATIYSALGCRVTIVELLANVLPMLDREVARKQQANLKRLGIEIKTRVKITGVETGSGQVVATLENGEVLRAAKALISIGRTFNTADLGLEEAGVNLGARGEVLVDDCLRTSQPGIYAIGDITNKVQLAHAASAQGLAAVEGLLIGRPRHINYNQVPSIVFTVPEIATVGLTTETAGQQGIKTRVGKFPFLASGKALAMGEEDGFVKVVADSETDLLLGVHIIGPHASDLIAAAVLALRGGFTSEQLAATIQAHPSLPEALVEAAEGVHGQAIHS